MSRMQVLRRTGCAGLLAGVAGFMTIYLVFAFLAGSQGQAVRLRWESTFGTLESLTERWPDREANESALQLERLTPAVGIDIRTRSADREVPIDKDRLDAFRAIKGHLGKFVEREVERTHPSDAPLHAELEAFLIDRAEAIEAVRRHLVDQPAPRWERRMSALAAAPIPNLLGHIDLQKLLIAEALYRSRRGEHDRAAESLEASWKLSTSIHEDPILIEQLIVISGARMQAGAIRQLERVPEIWEKRLRLAPYRERFLNAAEFEGWHWTHLGENLEAMIPIGEGPAAEIRPDGILKRLARPYISFCLSHTSGEYYKRVTALRRAEPTCDTPLERHGLDLDIQVPRWNIVGGMMAFDISNAVDRMRRLEVDQELTLNIMQARRLGLELPAEGSASAVCPEDRWQWTVGDEGTTVGLDRELQWQETTGIHLPTRFVLPHGSDDVEH